MLLKITFLKKIKFPKGAQTHAQSVSGVDLPTNYYSYSQHKTLKESYLGLLLLLVAVVAIVSIISIVVVVVVALLLVAPLYVSTVVVVVVLSVRSRGRSRRLAGNRMNQWSCEPSQVSSIGLDLNFDVNIFG